MSTAKEEVRRILDRLPDGATFEDIQYHIYVIQQVERGLKDLDDNHVISHDEMKQRMGNVEWRQYAR